MSEQREGVTPLSRTVASCPRSSQHLNTLSSGLLLSIVAPRVIDEMVVFKDPLETIEMSLRNVHWCHQSLQRLQRL